MVFLPNFIHLFFFIFWPEGIIHFPPVVLVKIDEDDLLILSMDGIDLNTLGELDRIP